MICKVTRKYIDKLDNEYVDGQIFESEILCNYFVNMLTNLIDIFVKRHIFVIVG